MAIQTHHPLYTYRLPEWEKMRDCYAGQSVVKARRDRYLPPTQGQVLDGWGLVGPVQTPLPDGQGYSITHQAGGCSKGELAYRAYLTRAVFHDFVSEAVELMLGLMHQKDATVELPAAMEPLRAKATTRGESLQMLLRRVNEQQLVSGRLGLFADMVKDPDPKNPIPHIATYTERSIINWDDGTGEDEILASLNMLVLDESALVRQSDGFDWKVVNKYRVLVLGDLMADDVAGGTALYRAGVFSNEDGSDRPMEFSEDSLIEPNIRGEKLTEIPFVFVNSKDIVAAPDNPPLLGLADLALTIYRGEADYRQNLHWQGQDTLVIIGDPSGDDETRVGAGAKMTLPLGGDAKFIGVSSQGLPEQRQALDADKVAANAKAGQLISTKNKAAESGDALKIRVGSQTASLHQIAKTGAAGLERILRIIARWMRLNPDEVIVKPNLDFADAELTGQTLVQMMTAKSMGAPLSNQSIHDLMQQRGVTSLTFEEEVALIGSEEPLVAPPDPAVSGGPAGAQ